MVSKLSAAMFTTPAKFNSVIIDGEADPSSDSSECEICQDPPVIETTQDLTSDTTALGGTLDELSKLHCESATRVEQTVLLADATSATVRFPYFPAETGSPSPSSSSEDNIPSQAHVDADACLLDELSHRFLRYDHVPPISDARWHQLNADRWASPRAAPASVTRVTRGKARLPADYLEFNQRRRKRSSGGPTVMSRTAQVRPPPPTGRVPPPPPVARQRRAPRAATPPRLPGYSRAAIPDAKPSFVGRARAPAARAVPPPSWRALQRRSPPREPPAPIPPVARRLPRAQLAECVQHPGRRTREYIRERVRQRRGSPPPGAGCDAVEAPGRAEEGPPSARGRRERLEDLMREGDVAEWEAPRRRAARESDDDLLAIPEECLTDSETADVIRPHPAYYDPHETKAAKLRNQAVRQRLALREARGRIEGEEQRARERHQRKLGERMGPTIRYLEKEVEQKKPGIEQLRKDKHEQNLRDAVDPICSAIRSAENTEFIVSRQMGVNAKRSERNREKKDQRGKEEKDEQAKLALRGRKKQRNMALCDPR